MKDDINEKLLRAILNDQKNDQSSEESATVLHMIGRSFKGTFRYTFVFVVTFQLIVAALAVYCGYQMLTLTGLDDKLEWLAGLILSTLTFAILRLWFFMELNRLSVLRELKRVELQLALLAEKTQQLTAG
jgi:uncharacterized membrane protein YciS (DUF1049 family)